MSAVRSPLRLLPWWVTQECLVCLFLVGILSTYQLVGQSCPSSCPTNSSCSQSESYSPDPCLYPNSPYNCAGTDQQAGGCCQYGSSPVIIDVSGRGFDLTSPEDGVAFDFFGDGKQWQMAWTARAAANAWLVLDRNKNGLVDNGKEMFGNITTQRPNPQPNGFAALALFDQPLYGGNQDGVIDSKDKIFSYLRLWIDRNHNGISEENELFALATLGIQGISLKYSEDKRVDKYGNAFRYKAEIFSVDQDGARQPGRWAYDVFLRRSPVVQGK